MRVWLVNDNGTLCWAPPGTAVDPTVAVEADVPDALLDRFRSCALESSGTQQEILDTLTEAQRQHLSDHMVYFTTGPASAIMYAGQEGDRQAAEEAANQVLERLQALEVDLDFGYLGAEDEIKERVTAVFLPALTLIRVTQTSTRPLPTRDALAERIFITARTAMGDLPGLDRWPTWAEGKEDREGQVASAIADAVIQAFQGSDPGRPVPDTP